MFLRNRTLPFTPSSLQKPWASAASLVIASHASMPMIDQVPDDSQRLPAPLIGMPATAEAVSWQAVATTGMPALPMTAATASRTGPNTVPGATISPKILRGRPSASITSHAQSPVRGSSNCEVEAIVRSTAWRPVSQ